MMISLLPELILDQAHAHPEAPAVLCGPSRVTYQELERSARQVAHALTARGVGEESVVGVLISPGPDMVAALLGIWLAGGCYLPLDPLAPPGRLRRVVELAGARTVLADDAAAAGKLELPPDVTVSHVAELAASGTAQWAAERPAGPRQAAYMIFTSGSTGTPKGVVIEHEGVANRVRWGVRALGLSPADRVLQKTPLTFDAAAWEIFAPLICGAPVTFGRLDAGRDAGELIASIREQQATVVQVVPTMLRLLVDEPDLGQCRSLRLICSAGEALHAELCQRVLAVADVEIWNTYGPTECSIDFMAARFDPAQRSGPVPIGRPIDNMDYLLIPPDEEATDGADVQELYARGAGIARGYHGDPASTAERFVPDVPDIASDADIVGVAARAPGQPGARMYRTGDLVRVRRNGALEFVGRADAQVKINGVRIEPGEVEAALEAHPAVVRAAVRAVTDSRGTRRLAAWVAMSPGGEAGELPAYLRDRLPPAMNPSVFTTVDALPRTTSGKTDRSRLPEPDWTGTIRTSGAARPRTAEERIVLAAWRQLFDAAQDEIGLDDDFFRRGGHSLMMARLVAVLTEKSGLRLDFRELHYATTARDQARLLKQATVARPIERLPAGARLPLSHAQERFWVLDRMNPGSREYLLPVFVWLPAGVREDTVEQALSALVARHDILRTRYAMDGDGLCAHVEPAIRIPLSTVETSPQEMGKIVAGELAEGFDLSAAPLFRATLVRDGGDEQLLLLVCHHIIGDGWSSRLLDQELRELVAALGEQRAAELTELPLRYADAVAWQREQLTEELMAGQLEYWRQALAGLPALDLPTIGRRPAQRSIEGTSVAVDLPAEVVDALLAIGRHARVTPFVTFLTLWTILLARAGDRWDFGVGTPHAGRSRPEFHDLVGPLLNIVAIRAGLDPEMTFAEALARVGDVCREGFARHAVPLEAVIDAVAPPRDSSRTPLFQTIFTMAGDDTVGQRPRQRNLEILHQAWQVARTDLALTLWPFPDGRYGGAIEYATTLYPQSMATGLASRLRSLAERFAADPGLAVGAPAEPSPHEATILGFVRDLLKHDEIGLDDDIMDRGGNSLMAARLLWNVQNAFGVDVSMRAFFDQPTAQGLAREVERLIRAEFIEQNGEGL
jgi:amino acid adenylation domain-containing protein